MQFAALTGLRTPLTPFSILIWLLLVVRMPTNFVKYCRAGNQAVRAGKSHQKAAEADLQPSSGAALCNAKLWTAEPITNICLGCMLAYRLPGQQYAPSSAV